MTAAEPAKPSRRGYCDVCLGPVFHDAFAQWGHTERDDYGHRAVLTLEADPETRKRRPATRWWALVDVEGNVVSHKKRTAAETEAYALAIFNRRGLGYTVRGMTESERRANARAERERELNG